MAGAQRVCLWFCGAWCVGIKGVSRWWWRRRWLVCLVRVVARAFWVAVSAWRGRGCVALVWGIKGVKRWWWRQLWLVWPVLVVLRGGRFGPERDLDGT